MVRQFAAILVTVLVFVPNASAQVRNTAPRSAQQSPKSASGQRPVTPVSRQNAAGATQQAPAGKSETPSAAQGTTPKAQVEMRPVAGQRRAPEMSPEMEQEMDRLLTQWAQASDRIKRLEGRHFRIVYDLTFETESQSEGEFGYEDPDKGRIDVTPVEITEALKEARRAEVQKAKDEKRRSSVRVKQNGEPFDLVPALQEEWYCDGQRVYSLDVQKKEAVVAQLPSEMQGENIMDSPLPFLFGMPPEKARRRFEMAFAGGKFDPRTGKASLVIYPNLPQDSQSWSHADVILDLKTFLPVAVQLFDPADTKITVYKFRDFKVNGTLGGFFAKLQGKNPFTPNLDGYNTIVAGEQTADQLNAKPPGEMKSVEALPRENLLVNVEGIAWKDAELQLSRQGLKRDKENPKSGQVLLVQGDPAKNPDQVYTVQRQEPAPGTPITPKTVVRLVIFTDPKTQTK